MPTFCREARNAWSSPVMSPGSACAGAARPIAVHTLRTANSIFITHPSSESGCPLAQLRVRRHDFGFAAFGQVHRVNTGFLRKLFQQAVETGLIDGVMLHAFGFFRYLRDQTLQLLR